MTSFEPIAVSQKIKEGFVDYITTSFDLADPVYQSNLREQLLQPGYIAKGPYLELSGSYKAGRSISDLIEAGIANPLFRKLEPVAENDRELKLDRPLYLHQEHALCLANEGHNLVVTTGTGSGKTECFLIPIINHLLCEQERQGFLEDAVRAIIIYPMNALANDQMKRMRDLLKGYPKITFGLYNGNTRHKETDARKAYSTAHNGATPLDNELISRETMQKTPPHILITNYSMLEYMMLRPKDDKVISGAKLRFIVLDEAHIYRGTTGMETAMLMRRLRARLDQPELARYILTSATLGGKDADQDIVTFAENLCGVTFQTKHIIRSQNALPPMLGEQDYPKALFTALAKRAEPVAQILDRYQIADPCPEGDEGEKIFSLLLGSRIFAKLVEYTRQPKALSELCQELSAYLPLSEDDLTDLIAVCVQAERGKSSLIKARYHYFVRTLEGAYITLGKSAKEKRLFLDRKESFVEGEQQWEVFEAAVCSDCGRLAVTGKENPEGYLRQVARKTEADPKECDYYLLKNGMDEILEADEVEGGDDEAEEQAGEGNFVLCSRCGKLGTQADLQFGPICDCENPYYAPVIQTLRTKSGRTKCPACGFGHFRSFYLGNEAATAVLGTELFDQLPDQKMDLQSTIKARQEMKAIQEDVSNPFRRLNKPTVAPTITESNDRQFLCFSDSRNEAAFFASYMERSYEEFLRRRGMWKIVEEMKANGETRLSVPAFVERLIRLFDCNETFQQWNPDKKTSQDSIHEESKRNAWIAILNEMYNARRGTSLPSLGMLAFSYPRNKELAEALAEAYELPTADLWACWTYWLWMAFIAGLSILDVSMPLRILSVNISFLHQLNIC